MTKKSDRIKQLENDIYVWKQCLLDPELSALDKKDLNVIVNMKMRQLERVKRDTN